MWLLAVPHRGFVLGLGRDRKRYQGGPLVDDQQTNGPQSYSHKLLTTCANNLKERGFKILPKSFQQSPASRDHDGGLGKPGADTS